MTTAVVMETEEPTTETTATVGLVRVSEERLEAIAARHQAATFEPWRRVGPEIVSDVAGVVVRADRNGGGGVLRDADGDFIEHSRIDVPDLAADLRDERARSAFWRELAKANAATAARLTERVGKLSEALDRATEEAAERGERLSKALGREDWYRGRDDEQDAEIDRLRDRLGEAPVKRDHGAEIIDLAMRRLGAEIGQDDEKQQTAEEARAELEASGVDVDAFLERMAKRIRDEGHAPSSIVGLVREVPGGLEVVSIEGKDTP